MKKKIIATMMTLCMVFSVLTSSVIQAHAADEEPPMLSKSFDSFVSCQFYIRGMNAAGTVLQKLGDVTENDTFKEVTSFISTWVFGVSDSSETLGEIQNTCNQILSTVTDIEDISKNVESLENAQAIKDAATACDTAWENQVHNVINAGNGEENIKNIYNAYINYLSYSCGYKTLPAGKTVEDYEEAYIDSAIDLCALNANGQYNDSYGSRDEYYKHIMYTTDVVDTIFTTKINTLLDNLEYDGNGGRYVDKAALYAYYALPFSTDQAQFVDAAVEQQLNQVVTLIMLYQDFLSQRAEYYAVLNEKQADGYKTIAECDKKYNEYSKMYVNILSALEEKVTSFLSDPILLKDGYICAKTTLNKYVRDDSASTEANNNQSFKLKCNDNYNSKITQTPSFFKNASVSISDGNLVFKPFYILNGEVHKDAAKLAEFNSYKETYHFNLYGPSYYSRVYSLTNNYNCLKNGVYSDGNNNYAAVTDGNQLKNIINSTFYSAYGETPYSYFSDYIKGYNNNDLICLFLRSNAKWVSSPYNSDYHLPLFNIKTSKSISASWDSEMISQLTINDNKDKYKYVAILAPQSNVTNTTVDTLTVSNGEATVNGFVKSTFEAGSTVTIKAKAPKNNVITTVKAQYHGDMSDPSKVTSEKVLCSNADSNEIELSYAVPYTNVTILVDTQEVSTPLNTDSKGNYLVYSYSDLCKMAEMVNSGYTKYTNGSYSLMNDIVCTGKVWTPIGTGDVNFGGTLNGNGKSIIGLNRDAGTADGNRQPLFNVVGKTATIDNVIFTGADVFSAEAPVKGSGVICKHNYGLIKNCLISDSDVQLGNWHYLGGVAGLNNGTIENCAVVNTSITRRWGGCSTHTMGGITETNNGTVKNCFTFNCGFNNGDVSRNSPIVSSGNAPENCYYYTGSNINKTYGTEKTIAQFNSGEVTYQLNNGVTNSEQSWYQCIGSDATPTLKSNGYDTVYKTENGTYTN